MPSDAQVCAPTGPRPTHAQVLVSPGVQSMLLCSSLPADPAAPPCDGAPPLDGAPPDPVPPVPGSPFPVSGQMHDSYWPSASHVAAPWALSGHSHGSTEPGTHSGSTPASSDPGMGGGGGMSLPDEPPFPPLVSGGVPASSFDPDSPAPPPAEDPAAPGAPAAPAEPISPGAPAALSSVGKSTSSGAHPVRSANAVNVMVLRIIWLSFFLSPSKGVETVDCPV